ncbi:poly-gamma-glutamate synthase PgsB [Hoyosella rhizosphaerae]|uniref:Poly-gamma-glutamate synthase PgsB n=1 Tax=Hoyosella rhizosphaerae TaxID=1755582 RepID=A0A916XA57_9ACTN|nr:poly-gamma-glutamate synthase PgsB [Hoyosella rhizosphaerae]MBN4926813.1 poly-gamma-glutamate synthase PgsB [Hoyosella rhizosphaerae]GGC56269.1 poly-gamma-glutamate synthase PgsB [Hoyosella rhizosphaerae]
MIRAIESVALLTVMATLLLGYWHFTVTRHGKRLENLNLIVHVNGIRGKSSVTRLVAGVLRESGITTVAKTTGSAAKTIFRDGSEAPIHRYGAATINEQIEFVSQVVTPDIDAMVIECMAVRPLYQKYSQDMIVKSNISIITNVREDHQEEMGETLEEIADSLANTVPLNGYLITAEDRPHLRNRLAAAAKRRNTELIYADSSQVDDRDMEGFDYIQHRENVAIGLEIAKLAGIPRHVAIRGMWNSAPDIGVIRLREYEIRDKTVLWVPMFAANDRESVIANMKLLKGRIPAKASTIALLNNRNDRGRRAELFAHMVPNDLSDYLDTVITLGAYEKSVTATMVREGFSADRIRNLGESSNATIENLLDTVAQSIDGDFGVLVGMVNIHTDQAEQLMEHFAHLDAELGSHDADLDLAVQRRFAMADILGSLKIRRRGGGDQ